MAAIRLFLLTRPYVFSICLFGLGPASALQAADGLEAARKSLQASMGQWSVTPKIRIGGNARFHLRSNGFPTDDKQGVYRGVGAAYSQRAALCLAPGKHYRMQPVRVSTRSNRIRIDVFKCRSLFLIEAGRPLTPQDLTPAAVQQALGGVFHFAQNSGMSVSEARLQAALHPIEVSATHTVFKSIRLANPAGWRVNQEGERVFLRRPQLEIRLGSRALKTEELNAGAELVLQDAIPRKLLRSARKLDPQARLQRIAQVVARGELMLGSADVIYQNTYERHDWVFHRAAGLLHTMRAQSKVRDSAELNPVMNQLIASVQVATSADHEVAEHNGLPTPSAVFSEPGEILQSVRLSPSATQLHPGDILQVTAQYTLAADDGLRVRDVRILHRGEQTLVRQPLQSARLIPPGTYENVHTQPIPKDTEPGLYGYIAQLCANDTCVVRKIRLEID